MIEVLFNGKGRKIVYTIQLKLHSIFRKYASLVKKFVRNDENKISFTKEKSVIDLSLNKESTDKWPAITGARNNSV